MYILQEEKNILDADKSCLFASEDCFLLKPIYFIFWVFLFLLPVRSPSLDFSFSSSFTVKDKVIMQRPERKREGRGKAFRFLIFFFFNYVFLGKKETLCFFLDQYSNDLVTTFSFFLHPFFFLSWIYCRCRKKTEASVSLS